MLTKKIAALSVATISTLGVMLAISPAHATVDCSVPTLINGSFEDYTVGTPPLASDPDASVIGDWMNDWGAPKQFLFLDLDVAPQALPGWETTNTENYVELQRQVAGYEQDGSTLDPGYFDSLAVQPARGSVWAELNATQDAALYQDIQLTAGTEYTWSIKHHGRVSSLDATDEMFVFIGDDSGAPGSLVQQTDFDKYLPINDDLFVGAPLYSYDFTPASQILGSLEDGWVMYRGTYTPVTSGTYRFQFQAVNGWALTVGNMIDDLEFAPTECVSDPTLDPNLASSSGSNLPDTGLNGATVASMAGIGSLLIAAGAVVMIRRRRSNA